MSRIEKEFEDLKEQYYPGSKKKIPKRDKKPKQETVEPSVASWVEKPKVYKVGGVDREFFTIGALAAALNRKPVSIRAWEVQGIIPYSRWRTPNQGTVPGRRLYTREQIDGIVQIAKEEGILGRGKVKDFRETNFTSRVIELFKDLGGLGVKPK